MIAAVAKFLLADSAECMCVFGSFSLGEDSSLAGARARAVAYNLVRFGVKSHQLRWQAGGPENRRISDAARARLTKNEQVIADQLNRDVSFFSCGWSWDAHELAP